MDFPSQISNNHLLFGIDISIHVVILFAIVSMFFMFYISKKESRAINDEINDNINKAMDKIIDKMPPNLLNTLHQNANPDIINKLKKTYEKEDKYVESHNRWLFKTIWYTNGVLFLVCALTILLLMYQCGTNINVKEMLMTNLVTFIFIGVIEVIFFINVGSKYIPSKPSTIVNTFLDDIQAKL